MTASALTLTDVAGDGIGRLSGPGLRHRYLDRSLRVTTVVEAVYERITTRGEDAVWISLVRRSDALRRAAELDALAAELLAAGQPLPALFGLPFGVKDNIDVAGLPTTAGCPEFAYPAVASAPLVERLLAAGAVLIGKTNLDQFATGLSGARSPYGVPASPFDPAWICGGSSSGSAVAVAVDVVSFAIGTDTAGSGRVPAALTGTVGVKPSRGLVSTRGIVPACRSLDCPSVHASTVAEGAAVLAVLAGPDEVDPYSRRLPVPPPLPPAIDLSTIRLAVPLATQLAEAGDWFDVVAERLDRRGLTLVPIDFEDFFAAGALLYEGGWVAERYGGLADFLSAHPEAVQPAVGEVVGRGAGVTGAGVFASQHRLAELAARTSAQLATVDGLLVPTVTRSWTIAEMLADPITLNARLGRFTTFGNLLDLCGVAVPAGFDEAGLPYGVTVLAPAGADAAVAGLAAAVQRELLGEPVDVPSVTAPTGSVRLAVVGAHLAGQPLHGELTAVGGTLVARTRTAAEYRLYALPGDEPVRPGLLRVSDGGAAVEVEVYAVPVTALGEILAAVPAPLTLGSVRLAGGEVVTGYLCEAHATNGAEDITRHGGWRAYLAATSA